MIAAFLQFDDETILVLGLTHTDLALLATGDEPPPMNIGKLAADLQSPLPTRVQILVGANNDQIQARIEGALNPGVETNMLPDDQVASYLGTESGDEDVADGRQRADEAQEAVLAAARELAVKQARARLN